MLFHPRKFDECVDFWIKKDSKNTYSIEREEASSNFRIAMVRTFKGKFGEDVEVT